MTKTEVYSKRRQELVTELDDLLEYAEAIQNPSDKILRKATSLVSELGNLRVPSNKQIKI